MNTHPPDVEQGAHHEVHRLRRYRGHRPGGRPPGPGRGPRGHRRGAGSRGTGRHRRTAGGGPRRPDRRGPAARRGDRPRRGPVRPRRTPAQGRRRRRTAHPHRADGPGGGGRAPAARGERRPGRPARRGRRRPGPHDALARLGGPEGRVRRPAGDGGRAGAQRHGLDGRAPAAASEQAAHLLLSDVRGRLPAQGPLHRPRRRGPRDADHGDGRGNREAGRWGWPIRSGTDRRRAAGAQA